MYSSENAPDLEQLVEQHSELVRRIAYHLLARLPANVSVDDLIQAGMLGLLDAARKYHYGKGASFETYAGIRIRGAMIDEMRRGEWAPRSVYRNARAIRNAMQQVENRLGRDATDREVAEELGISVEEYHSMAQDSLATRLFSVDELRSVDEHLEQAGDESEQQNEPLAEIQDESLREHLAKAIATLPEREQLVLSLYYDEGLNLKEIGAVLGVTESRVSQIHSQAAHRLRARLSGWL
jgi:RNA polymerase sigma factor for flagellar operon FliA